MRCEYNVGPIPNVKQLKKPEKVKEASIQELLRKKNARSKYKWKRPTHERA